MAKLKRTVIIGGASGSSGPVTFKIVKGQTFITERTSPSNPNTASQQAARSRFTNSAKAYRAFNATQVAQWDDYAMNHTAHDSITGGKKSTDGINSYLGLATKYLQVNGSGTPPTTPPATSYVPPTVTVTAVGATGKVTFTASAAVPVGSKVELMIQKLPTANRKPQKGAYRTGGFAQFPLGSLSQDVTVTPGFYAAAYRFVNTATGQISAIQPIGVSTVSLALATKKAA